MKTGSEAPTAGGGWNAGLLGLAALALGLILWGVFAQQGYAVLPPGLEAERLAPTEVDGIPTETAAALVHELRRHRPGDSVRLASGRAVVLEGELSGLLLVITLLGAVAFWAVCVFALAPRLGKPGIADLAVSLMLVALSIAIGGTTVPHGPGETALSILFLVSVSLMGPFFVRFSLAFPRPLAGRRIARRLGMALPLLGVGIAAWTTVTWLRAVSLPGATGVAATEAPTDALYLSLALCLAIACFNLYRSSRTARLDRERRQAKWILWGLAIGAAPYVLLRAVPRALFGIEPPWPPAVDRVVELAIPLTFAVAVARERFLDIDVIIRRSILYSLLALAGAALFFGTAVLLADVVFDGLGLPDTWTPWAWAIAGSLTGLLYRPARRALGRWVDRLFFRLQHAQDEALAVLEHDLTAAREQTEAAAALLAFLESALRPEAALVLVRTGYGDSRSWERAGTLALDAGLLLSTCGDEAALLASPDATGTPEAERADFPRELEDGGARLVQPVRTKGALLGVLVVGEKATGRHYVTEDLQSLRAAAARATVGLERLALVQRAAEEATERHALAKVARQKADFFAGLAHDLRNPVTTVQLSARNLLDELAGPITDRQRTYLQGIGASSGQLARLVDNLVDLGRLDVAIPERPAEPVDLAAVAREVALALAPIAHERRATIALKLPEGLPLVRGRREAAFQIAINLVDNALKYTAPETEVEVRLEGHDDGRAVALTVRDHGPGLPADRERLFALFAQGPESPHAKAKGFGIGLHIVRTWTKSLGGTVMAEDASGGGARFTCRLPCWTGEETE